MLQAAEAIVGASLTESAEPIHVPEFDPGHGMSAGAVAPSWWNNTGFRLLVDRFQATLSLTQDDTEPRAAERS